MAPDGGAEPRSRRVRRVLVDRSRVLLMVARSGRLRRSCDVVGAWSRVTTGRIAIANAGRIEVGSRTRFMADHGPIELRTAPGGLLTIGHRVAVNFGTAIEATGRVAIGDDVSIGPNCVISDDEAGSIDRPSGAAPRPVHIGNGVWLASRVTVLPGSLVGDGSVVTAGSIVDGEIPAGVLAGGIPARVLRRLDDAAHGDPGAIVVPPPAAAAMATAATPTAAAAPDRPVLGRGLLIADFTVDELARALRSPRSPALLDAEVAPFGAVVPSLLAPDSAGTDFAVVWTQPEAVLPSVVRARAFEPVTEADVVEEVTQFASLVRRGLAAYRCVVVPTWTRPPWDRGRGLGDARVGGVAWAVAVANRALADALSDAPGVFVVDAQRWLTNAADGGYSDRLWYLGKIPFTAAVFEAAAHDVATAYLAVTTAARKLVVVDLDNTMWGGVVGDDGWEELRLGGHDGVGEAFVDFQRGLQRLKQRGILLAIASKNEEQVALEAIDRHDAMVLRRDDFVSWRINWDDKAANIAAIAAELNLGLQSVVFLDDNPHERDRVREALPEVLVPEWPVDPVHYPRALAELTCFDTPSFTTEDAARTDLYVAERRREQLRTETGSIDDWIRNLGVVVTASPLDRANLARATQLLNKTNQLNLTTRRLSETELLEWASAPSHAVWCVSVADRVGDAGLTGIVSVAVDGDTARLVDFVLSCRVMGRRVESALVHVAATHAADRGAGELVATFLPTAKNAPTRRFFDGSGLTRDGDDYRWSLASPYPAPADVTIDVAAGSSARPS